MNNLVKALVAAVMLAVIFVGVLVFLNKDDGPGPIPSPEDSAARDVGDDPKENDPRPAVTGVAPARRLEVIGVVRAAEGEGLAGATVQAFVLEGSTAAPRPVLAKRVQSAEGGAFSIPDLAPGRYRFTARLTGFQEGRIERTLLEAEDPAPLEFSLTSGLSISGRIQDSFGQPVGGASVSAFLERVSENASLEDSLQALIQINEMQAEEGIYATSEADGSYQLSGLQASGYRLRVAASGLSPAARRHVAAGSTDVDFTLGVGGALSGRVLGEDGEPVAGAQLYVYRQDTKDSNIIEVVLQRLLPPIASTVADASGAYVFDMLGGDVGYRVLAQAPGYQIGQRENIVIGTGDQAEVDVQLARGNTIRGVVYAPGGRPLEGALVKANLQAARPQAPQLSLIDEGLRTDADGRFVFDTLEEGNYRIVVSHDDYASHQEQKVKPNGAELTIELTEGAALQGTVTDSSTGQPIPGAVITVRDVAAIEKKGVAGADGSYIVRGVTVQRTKEAAVTVDADGYARLNQSRIPVEEGRVSDGADFQLDKNARVSGIVTDSTGSPIAGCRVTVRRQNNPTTPIHVVVGGPAVSGADGSFVIEDVAPGIGGFLSGKHPDFLDSESEPFDLGPGESLQDLALSMRIGGSISGVVVDESGQPLEGASVGVRDERLGDVSPSSLTRHATSDAQGRWVIGSVEEGTHTIIAELRGYLRYESDGIAVTEGHATTDITVRMTQGAVLAGHIYDSHNDPISGATVVVTDTSDGLRKPQTKSDSNGYYSFDNLGQYPVRVQVKAKGYTTFLAQEQPVNREDVDFVLARLGALRGVVVNQHGDTLRTFSVSPRIIEGDREFQRTPSKTFNAGSGDGSFLFKEIPPGDYKIVVGCPGFAAASLEGVVVREDEVVDLGRVVLQEGGKVAGVVIDGETGEPIFGARIIVEEGRAALIQAPLGVGRSVRERRRSTQLGQKRTDREGAFFLEGLAKETITIRVEHRGYMRQRLEIRAGSEDLVISMERGGTIEGDVRDPRGNPVDGLQMLLSGMGINDTAHTDRKGVFTFTGLVDGTYDIRISMFGKVGKGTPQRKRSPAVGQPQRVQVVDGRAEFLSFEVDPSTVRSPRKGHDSN